MKITIDVPEYVVEYFNGVKEIGTKLPDDSIKSLVEIFIEISCINTLQQQDQGDIATRWAMSGVASKALKIGATILEQVEKIK